MSTSSTPSGPSIQRFRPTPYGDVVRSGDLTNPGGFGMLWTGYFLMDHNYRCRRRAGCDSWLLTLTLSGSAAYRLPDGGIVRTVPGDLVLLPPSAPQDISVNEQAESWEWLWVHFHPPVKWLEWLAWSDHGFGTLLLSTTEGTERTTITEQFSLLHRLDSTARWRREELSANALERLLLLCDAINPANRAHRIDPDIQKAMIFIVEQLSHPITLADIARASNQSVSRLTHLFHKQVGTTPQQYLEEQRMQTAARLLVNTRFSIKQIAGRVGFNDPCYFAIRFRRRMNYTPTQYRRQHNIPIRP